MKKEYKLWEVLSEIENNEDMDFENEDFLITMDESSRCMMAIDKHTNDIAEGSLLNHLLERTYTKVIQEEDDSVRVSRIGYALIGKEQTLINTGVLFPNGGSVLMKSTVGVEDGDSNAPDIMIEFVDADAIESFQDVLEDLKDQMLGECK